MELNGSRGRADASRVPELVLAFLILLPTAIVLLAAGSLAFGGEVAAWQLFAGVLLAAGVLIAAQPGARRSIGLVVAATLVLAAAASLYVRWLYDLYHDSQAYHLPAVIALAQGWNPIHHGHPCTGAVPFLDIVHCNLPYCYPKSSWIVSAVLYDLVGDLEVGKLANYWYTAALYLSAYLFFGRFVSLSRPKVWLFTLVVGSNPVLFSELGSAYVDAQLAAQLGILCFALLEVVLFRTPGRMLLACASIVFLVNVKFTGLAFALLFGALLPTLAGLLGERERMLRIWLGLAPAYLIGVLFVGYNPYVTNALEYGNPLFPAINTKRGTNVVQRQADAEFLSHNRFARFTIATFSVSREGDSKKPRFAAPFSTLAVSPKMGERFSGFGPLYSGILLVALGLLWALRGPVPIYVALVALLSVFAVPTGWWARLTPQGWWLPLVVLIPLAARDPRRTVRCVAVAGLCVLLVNSGLKLYAVTELQWRESGNRWKAIDDAAQRRLVVARNDELGRSARAFYFTTRQRLLDKNVAFEEVVTSPCSKPVRLDAMDLCRSD